MSVKLPYSIREAIDRRFADLRIDIVVDFGGYSLKSVLFAAFCKASRRVIYQHNDLWAEYSNPLKKHQSLGIIFSTYNQFDAVVAVSPEIRSVNLGKLGHFYSPKSKIHSARNVLCVERFRDRLDQHIDLAVNMTLAKCRKRFICAARLSPEKNHDRLLRAFATAVSNGLDADLLLVGDGPLRRELDALVASLNIKERVLFTGLVDNALPLMKNSDCFVLASDYEGQPMVLLEALAMGLPCIATDIPGNRSVLGGGLGTLVEPSVEAFAEAMLKFSVSDRLPVNFDAEEYDRLAMQDFYEKVCGIDTAFEKASSNENSEVH